MSEHVEQLARLLEYFTDDTVVAVRFDNTERPVSCGVVIREYTQLIPTYMEWRLVPDKMAERIAPVLKLSKFRKTDVGTWWGQPVRDHEINKRRYEGAAWMP